MNKIKSKYSPTKLVREDQYIAELICENSAARNKIKLPIKFWDLPEWRQFFVLQLKFARTYIDRYGFDKVVSFITNRKIYSLQARWIDDALSIYTMPKIQKQEKIETVEESLGRTNKNNKFDYLD